MQIYKECPLSQATNITKTVIEPYPSASLEGVYQLEYVHKTWEKKQTNKHTKEAEEEEHMQTSQLV